MNKINFGNIIDHGLIVALAMIIAAAISFTGGTVLAIAHMQPFQQCDICDAYDAGKCKRVVAVDLQQ